MPPKKLDSVDEVAYVKACLKHYKEPMAKANFDFEEVAKETGLKDATAAYQKFWGIKQKWGMAGSKTAGSPKATKAAGTPKKAGAGAGTGATVAGRKRGADGKVKEDVTVDAGGGGSDTGSLDANHGSDPVEGDSEAETEILEGEAKKAKPDDDED